MKKYMYYLVLPLLLITASICHSETVKKTVFMSTFGCTTKDTLNESLTFSGSNGYATILLVNGGLKDGESNKVSGTVVKVNGEVICDAKDLDQNTALVVKSVKLNMGENSIRAYVVGQPEGKLGVLIVQEVKVADEAGITKALGDTNTLETALKMSDGLGL